MARARPIIGVTPDMPFGAFASRVIAVRADEAKAQLSRSEAGAGPDLVHDRRVAIRRLRTALEVLAPALPGASLPFDPAELAAAARSSNGGAAAGAMQRVTAKRLGAVRARLDAVERPDDADALHELRIAAKRLRYVLEVAAPVIAGASKQGVATARSLQDVLGEIHDCDVLLPRIAAHRKALRAADVAAVRSGRRPPNATRYRGVQTVETLVRARREELREDLSAHHARWEAALAKLGDALA